MLTLTLKESVPVPLEADVLSPDTIAALPIDDVRALPVYLGKRQRRLDDFFAIEGQPGEELEIRGDAARVKWIGRGMTRGTLRVRGNAGMHLGSAMQGGAIEVFGDAGDWLGAEMSGGTIHVHGNAGGQVGAAYRGAMTGMRDGLIVVDGSAGLEVGMRMKRGTIVIGGPVRDFAGLQMKGGTIVLRQGAELRTGAWMNRGTIVSLQPIPLLPTFAYAASYNPTFLRLYARRLAAVGCRLPYDEGEGAYQRYTGDAAVPGRGEILVWQPGN
ncbi:MAG TPA: formylmethanofuran dehydrogenase subunit C [Vicinamibacterales bacterium]|nr:formylmethanofuran dehydrogenase subunit C [Vicinamibacterales bacterium]